MLISIVNRPLFCDAAPIVSIAPHEIPFDTVGLRALSSIGVLSSETNQTSSFRASKKIKIAIAAEMKKTP